MAGRKVSEPESVFAASTASLLLPVEDALSGDHITNFLFRALVLSAEERLDSSLVIYGVVFHVLLRMVVILSLDVGNLVLLLLLLLLLGLLSHNKKLMMLLLCLLLAIVAHAAMMVIDCLLFTQHYIR